MDNRKLRLKQYIEDISLIQENDSFDLLNIKKCIKDYDLTDDEQDQLEQICLSHTRKSEELLRNKNLKGSIISMERAVEINPLSVEFRNHIAQLYLMRANREGFKKSDRDMAYNSVVLSLKLNKENPIASSLMKEIRKKDNKISGKDLYKKLVLPIAALIIIIVIAIVWENDFKIPFLAQIEVESETEWEKEPQRESIIFTEQDIELDINNRLSDDFDINVTKSLISKVNGSYSYTIQGEIQAPEEALKSTDMNIYFISSSGKSLFNKSFSLIREEQIILPGEPIIIDEFFYIHYLPPDINHINFNLSNISFSDDFSSNSTNEKLYLQWNTSRPEGINISMILKNESSLNSYSGAFKNMKIELNNLGSEEIYNLDIALGWKDKYGNVLLESPENLISGDNPPLPEGKNRIYYLFAEISQEILNNTNEFYININGIN